MARIAGVFRRLIDKELLYPFSIMDRIITTLSASPHCSPLRVFVIEDSEPVRDLIIESLLDIPGIVVCGFSDSENDALKQLAMQSFDVILLDIELSQGNGMSLLRSLATSAHQADKVKIIFSNNISDAYRREGQRYGAHYFFDKTSEFLQLHRLLEKLAAGIPVT